MLRHITQGLALGAVLALTAGFSGSERVGTPNILPPEPRIFSPGSMHARFGPDVGFCWLRVKFLETNSRPTPSDFREICCLFLSERGQT